MCYLGQISSVISQPFSYPTKTRSFLLSKTTQSHVTNLTPEQLNDIRETFSLFDKDGDGTISVNELQNTMSSLGQRVSENEIKEMMEDAETSDNGSLDYPAFLSMMTRKSVNKDTNTEMAEVREHFILISGFILWFKK